MARAKPVSTREWDDAHLINAIVDIHADDPEFGYRFIADELRAAGHACSENRVARLCALQKVASSIVRKRRGAGKRPGPPVHDDHVGCIFHADGPDEIWLTDISEHPTFEGKLYICAVKDVCSRRIVGYAIGAAHDLTAGGCGASHRDRPPVSDWHARGPLRPRRPGRVQAVVASP